MFTLVISDSRGNGIQDLIKPIIDIGEVQVLQHRGAGYGKAIRDSLTIIDRRNPDLVILMVGICDITTRDRSTKLTSIRNTNQDKLTNNVILALNQAVKELREHGCKLISIATIAGIELADYNNPDRRYMNPEQYEEYRRTTKTTDPNQEQIDTTILLLNKKIVSINRLSASPTTWIASAVHAYFKGAYHHYYKHLQDGCHATQRTKQYWANQIVRTIKIIMKRNEKLAN